MKIRGRKARTFCFRKTSFVHSLSGTYHALLLGYFGLKFLPDVRHCVCWVLTWNLSCFVPNSVEILTWILRKKLFQDNFSEILYKPRLSFTKTCEISPYFLQFLLCVRITLKKFTQVLSYVAHTQVRRHVHKRIAEKRYGNKSRFVFGKPVLFILGLGLSTPYSLGFWSEIFTIHSSLCLLSFGWNLSPRFLPQDCQWTFYWSLPGLKGCAKLFDFFRGWILIYLAWNLSRFFLNSVEILKRNFRKKKKKNYFGRIFHKFSCKPRLSLPKLVKFRPTLCKKNYAPVLRWKNSHKYFHRLFAPT